MAYSVGGCGMSSPIIYHWHGDKLSASLEDSFGSVGPYGAQMPGTIMSDQYILLTEAEQQMKTPFASQGAW